MNILDYLDGVIELRPGLKHPILHVVVIKENSETYRLLFYKHDKTVHESASNLFRLRYEYQQNSGKEIKLNILMGRGFSVIKTTDKKIKEEFKKLDYTVEFSIDTAQSLNTCV
jgi:hypothetical protein